MKRLVNEAPAGLRPGFLLPSFRRERNSSPRRHSLWRRTAEAKISSLSSPRSRGRFFAKGDKKNILVILLLALFFRVVISFFGTLELDFNTFVAWSNSLSRFGLRTFYRQWSDYLPGYLYVLWLLGKVSYLVTWLPQTLLYKLPAIFSDLATGYLIYLILRKIKKSERLALMAASVYLFNPVVWANSTLWGQVDSLTALFSLLAVYLTGVNYLWSAIILAIGTAIKPQVAFTILVIFFLMYRERWRLGKIFAYLTIGLTTFVLLFVPFWPGGNLIKFIINRLLTTVNQYPYSSVNAFNFWGLGGMWRADSGGLISPSFFGALILLGSMALMARKLARRKHAEYLLLTVVFAMNFLFFSRMHERHFLPAFAPLTIAASLVPDLWLVYSGWSMTHLTNLYYSYVWITQNFKQVYSEFGIKLIIVFNLSLLAFLIKSIWKVSKKKRRPFLSASWLTKNFGSQRGVGDRISFPEVKFSKRLAYLLLTTVIAFSFFTRLFLITRPEKEYFDEVYHVFTARVMLAGDPKAWEWWNPHPEGYAYEWTHPPLAKLFMWAGMTLFGEKPLGWRLPGVIFGTGVTILIFLIAEALFNDKLLALLSAVIYSLEGLPLVMSRIGMNDVYILFFILLSFYLFLKDRHIFSAVAFGLAAASKWSAIWAVPIFLIAQISLRKKVKPSLVWFVILPPLVYLATYLPMFLVGDHNFDTFIGVQKQMWWYHTRLRADHPFTSSWYTWPFMIRPIWLYTSGLIGDKVANIYAMGNPLILWAGLAAVAVGLVQSIYTKSRHLALMIFAYLIFFVPWAASPRIMFFYHYLPSIPFLAIILAFQLRRFPKLTPCYLLLAALVFVYFYPHLAGIPVTKALDNSYYWFTSWR